MTATVLHRLSADLSALCAERRDRRAVLDGRTGRVWTYGALGEAVAAVQAALVNIGATRGDRVISVLPNSVEHLVAFLASLSSGLDFCPISPLSTFEEVRRSLDLSRPRIGFIPDQIDPALRAELRQRVGQHLIEIEPNADLGHEHVALTDGGGPAGKLILFTSGTTAQPKAMVLDGDRLWSSARAWVDFHAFLDAEARFYNILPMSYLGGLFNLGLIPFAVGGSVVVSDAFSGSSGLRFWKEVREHGVNVLWLTPTMARSLQALHRPGSETARIGQVRASFLGMAPSRLEEKERFEATFGFPLLENYALSETTFITSETLDLGRPRSPGSVGTVLPWVDVRLAVAEPGVAPEIEVRTPFLFDGYLTTDGAVSRALGVDGFFATGDLGTVDDGTLVLRGRSKDIIKKGGYLLVLRELEEIAEAVPGVAEAAAVGVEHAFYGESAVICVRSDGVGDPGAMVESVKIAVTTRVARFKWPSRIVALSSLPHTDSGKLQKRSLPERLATGADILASVNVQ